MATKIQTDEFPSSPLHVTYEEYVKNHGSTLPIYDGGKEQATKGHTSTRSHGKTEFYCGETFDLTFGPDMLRSHHDFDQFVHVEVLQVDPAQHEPVLVGLWRRPIRELYLDFLGSRLKELSAEEVQCWLVAVRVHHMDLCVFHALRLFALSCSS
jgi:hypothetical protein